MVAVDGLYRTAEHWGPDLHGRAVQVRRDREDPQAFGRSTWTRFHRFAQYR